MGVRHVGSKDHIQTAGPGCTFPSSLSHHEIHLKFKKLKILLSSWGTGDGTEFEARLGYGVSSKLPWATRV